MIAIRIIITGHAEPAHRFESPVVPSPGDQLTLHKGHSECRIVRIDSRSWHVYADPDTHNSVTLYCTEIASVTKSSFHVERE